MINKNKIKKFTLLLDILPNIRYVSIEKSIQGRKL